jgi:hypothetical protein
MKTKILIVASSLIVSSALKAQQKIDYLDRFINCMETCKPIENSQDRENCEASCAELVNCPTPTAKQLSAAQDLNSLISKFLLTKGTKGLIYSDATYQFFVLYASGKVNGYSVRSKNDGTEVSLPVVDFTVNSVKGYYIFDVTGKYLKVRQPDVSPFFEIAGTTITH